MHSNGRSNQQVNNQNVTINLGELILPKKKLCHSCTDDTPLKRKRPSSLVDDLQVASAAYESSKLGKDAPRDLKDIPSKLLAADSPAEIAALLKWLRAATRGMRAIPIKAPTPLTTPTLPTPSLPTPTLPLSRQAPAFGSFYSPNADSGPRYSQQYIPRAFATFPYVTPYVTPYVPAASAAAPAAQAPAAAAAQPAQAPAQPAPAQPAQPAQPAPAQPAQPAPAQPAPASMPPPPNLKPLTEDTPSPSAATPRAATSNLPPATVQKPDATQKPGGGEGGGEGGGGGGNPQISAQCVDAGGDQLGVDDNSSIVILDKATQCFYFAGIQTMPPKISVATDFTTLTADRKALVTWRDSNQIYLPSFHIDIIEKRLVDIETRLAIASKLNNFEMQAVSAKTVPQIDAIREQVIQYSNYLDAHGDSSSATGGRIVHIIDILDKNKRVILGTVIGDIATQSGLTDQRPVIRGITKNQQTEKESIAYDPKADGNDRIRQLKEWQKSLYYIDNSGSSLSETRSETRYAFAILTKNIDDALYNAGSTIFDQTNGSIQAAYTAVIARMPLTHKDIKVEMDDNNPKAFLLSYEDNYFPVIDGKPQKYDRYGDIYIENAPEPVVIYPNLLSDVSLPTAGDHAALAASRKTQLETWHKALYTVKKKTFLSTSETRSSSTVFNILNLEVEEAIRNDNQTILDITNGDIAAAYAVTWSEFQYNAPKPKTSVRFYNNGDVYTLEIDGVTVGSMLGSYQFNRFGDILDPYPTSGVIHFPNDSARPDHPYDIGKAVPKQPDFVEVAIPPSPERIQQLQEWKKQLWKLTGGGLFTTTEPFNVINKQIEDALARDSTTYLDRTNGNISAAYAAVLAEALFGVVIQNTTRIRFESGAAEVDFPGQSIYYLELDGAYLLDKRSFSVITPNKVRFNQFGYMQDNNARDRIYQLEHPNAKGRDPMIYHLGDRSSGGVTAGDGLTMERRKQIHTWMREIYVLDTPGSATNFLSRTLHRQLQDAIMKPEMITIMDINPKINVAYAVLQSNKTPQTSADLIEVPRLPELSGKRPFILQIDGENYPPVNHENAFFDEYGDPFEEGDPAHPSTTYPYSESTPRDDL